MNGSMKTTNCTSEGTQTVSSMLEQPHANIKWLNHKLQHHQHKHHQVGSCMQIPNLSL